MFISTTPLDQGIHRQFAEILHNTIKILSADDNTSNLLSTISQPKQHSSGQKVLISKPTGVQRGGGCPGEEKRGKGRPRENEMSIANHHLVPRRFLRCGRSWEIWVYGTPPPPATGLTSNIVEFRRERRGGEG